MYFKFQIKPVSGKPEREGDSIVRFTGQSEYINVNDVIASDTITRNGKQTQRFKTGIEPSEVLKNPLIPQSERESHKKVVEAYRPMLEDAFGAEDLDATNTYFWKRPEYGNLKVSSNDLGQIYDTRLPEHALLYFNIMGGAFIDTVGLSKEQSERFHIPFYIETENEFVSEDSDNYVIKANAFSLLSELSTSADNQALLYLGWVLHSDSNGFGSYSLSTPKSELFKMHAEYIEGKLTFTKKRNTPNKFVETAKSWKDGKIGRPRLMVEAYLKAAKVFSYLNSDKDGKLSLPSGLKLGFSIESAVDVLLQPKNNQEFEELRSFIEKKWAE